MKWLQWQPESKISLLYNEQYIQQFSWLGLGPKAIR